MEEHASSALLDVQNLSRSFGGIHALSDVSLTVTRGTIMSLIGPNGAGKTTFINVINGVYSPDSGAIRKTCDVLSCKPNRA